MKTAKALWALIFQLLALSMLAQVPQLINYQGVARDGNANAIKNKSIALKFEFRQGGPTSPVVFTEAQIVNTSNLGVFTTQIGKINTSGISVLNWQSGYMFLEVSLDTTGGTNYISLGVQQLITAPYAMQALSVPSTFTNNILTIGSGVNASSYTFSSLGTSPNTTITSTGGGATVSSSGTNTFNIDVPATSISAGTNVAVQGSHPNYTISSTPSLSINGNNLTISGGNTIPLPTSGTIAAVNTTLVSSGAATTTTLAPNSFSINVPVPTFTGTGQTTVLGSYPNYTINTPTISAGTTPTIVGLGSAVVSPTTGNSFSVSVANPTLSSSGNSITITQGTLVTTTTIAATPATSLNPGTNVSISGTNPYTIAATPTLNLLTANTLSISGGNSITIAPTLSISGNGTLSVGPLSNSISIAPSLLGTGAVSVSGTFPNYTIFATPAGSVSIISTSVTGTGLANVTSTATNVYNVDVASPVFTSSGPVSISGTYPNYTINSSAGTTYTNGTGISITSGSIISNTSPGITPTLVITATTAAAPSVISSGSSFSINVPPALVSALGNTITITQGTVVTTATIASTPNTSVTAGGGGIANITNPATNSFVVSVPGPSLTSTGNTLTITQGTAISTATIASTPNTSVAAGSGGIASITNPATNSFVVSVPGPSLTSTGNTLTITQGTAVSTATIASTPNTSVTAGSGGIANITNPATNSFVVSVPGPSLTSTGNTLTITQGTAVSTATIASTPNTSVTAGGGGIASITNPATNSFVVSVPGPSLTSNGNTLTITQGTAVSTATLAGTTYTNGTGISITSGSIITNTSPNQVVTISNAGNVGITGSYPSFTLSAPSASFTQGGVAAVTTISANSYSVGVPGPSLTSNGNTLTITQGTAVSSATVAGTTYTNGTGISITSGSIITNTSPDQVVTISNAGNIGITGSYPAFSLSAPSASFTQGGVVAITTISANSYSIGVPAPVFTQNGPSSITGTYPNFTVNSSTGTTYTNGTGISITSGSIITNTSPDQVVTISNAGNIGITGSYPAFSLSAPSASFTQGGVVGITTISANFYSIGVPAPTLAIASGSISISAGNSVALPVPAIAVSFSNAANPAVTATGNSFNINIPPTVAPNITTSSSLAAAGISTTSANNFNINIPSANFVTGGVVTISTVSANSYSIGVPAPTLAIASGSISISAGNSIALPVPAIAVSFSNAANPAVTASGNSFNINIPPTVAPNITISSTLTTAGISTTSANNFNINVPTPNISVSQTAAAAVGITTTSINNYNINIPLANGAWALLGNSGTTPGTNYIGTNDAQAFAVRTNGTERMRVSSTGLIGIGTTTATEHFQVESAANTQMSIISSATGVSNLFFGRPNFHFNGTIRYDNSTDNMNIWTANTSRILINGSNGFVGIGTGASAPTQMLDVNGYLRVAAGPLTTDEGWLMATPAAGTSLLRAGGRATIEMRLEQTNNAPMTFQTNSLERMRITGTGSVGVGTTTPDALFNVEGDIDMGVGNSVTGVYSGAIGSFHTVTGNRAFSFGNYTNASSLGSMIFGDWGGGAPTVLASSTSDEFSARFNGGYRFFTDGALTAGQGIFFSPSGFVGIGLTTPLYKLHVVDPTAYAKAIWGENTNTSTNDGFGVYGRSVNFAGYGYGGYFEGGYYGASCLASGGSYAFSAIGVAGNSTGTAGTRYGVYGAASGGATNYGVYCNGSGGYTGTWSNVSDKRFKENITPYTGALDKIMALEPKTYTLKKEEYSYMNFPEGTQIGLIAQDVEKIIPELVLNAVNPGPMDPATKRYIEGQEIKYKSMNYIGLTPVIVQAMKEQQAQIEDLKKQLDEQKKLIDALLKK